MTVDELTHAQVVFSLGVIHGAALRSDDALHRALEGLDDEHLGAAQSVASALLQAVRVIRAERRAATAGGGP